MPLAFEPTWDDFTGPGPRPIFGLAAYVERVSERPRVQRRTYPGLAGQQVMRLGSSGQRLRIRFTVGATDVTALAAYDTLIFGIEQSQQVGDFTDTQGLRYLDCLIENVQYASEIEPYSDELILDGVSRDYVLEVACPYSEPIFPIPADEIVAVF